ncbi:hypothetical protein TIFTF001_023392 [Ficus carica]|uniref:Uncharacterized protein n=1 Tax=Ficus carica TaxID=3494 RepID=A0AA88AG32_FICCA|nr:hypothetical protein TIFTF001_023392 [Ficus carica]
MLAKEGVKQSLVRWEQVLAGPDRDRSGRSGKPASKSARWSGSNRVFQTGLTGPGQASLENQRA